MTDGWPAGLTAAGAWQQGEHRGRPDRRPQPNPQRRFLLLSHPAGSSANLIFLADTSRLYPGTLNPPTTPRLKMVFIFPLRLFFFFFLVCSVDPRGIITALCPSLAVSSLAEAVKNRCRINGFHPASKHPPALRRGEIASGSFRRGEVEKNRSLLLLFLPVQTVCCGSRTPNRERRLYPGGQNLGPV